MNTAFVVSGGQPRARALTPVPAPAGDAEVVAPDDLAGVRDVAHGLAVGDGVERLVAARDDQARRADVVVEVLAADRQQVEHRHRVVDVGEPVDRGADRPRDRRSSDSTLLRACRGFTPNER